MIRHPKILHIRYKNDVPLLDRGLCPDKIITIAYSWSNETKELVYGAVTYNKKFRSDTWFRKSHYQTALNRFKSHPISVKFSEGCSFVEERVASFICNVGIYQLGVSSNTQRNSDILAYPKYESFLRSIVEYYGDYDFIFHREDVLGKTYSSEDQKNIKLFDLSEERAVLRDEIKAMQEWCRDKKVDDNIEDDFLVENNQQSTSGMISFMAGIMFMWMYSIYIYQKNCGNH